MNHPNSNCCPLSWDQRIPNEPILDRNFLIQRPPLIPQDIPRTTNECISSLDRPWLLYDRATEKTLMSYWHHHTNTDKFQGVNTPSTVAKSLDKMTDKFPNRPWLHGIHRNIDKDSNLSNRNYYNPKDCIIPCVQYDVAGFNRIADSALFKEMIKDSINMNFCGKAGRIWNQSTSMKANEPDDYDHESFIRSCPKLKQYQK